MIASILTAIRMAIGVHVEALLPGGGGAVTSGGGGEPPPKDEASLKEYIRNELQALASIIGRLGMKAAEALPGITGGIISWILNRAKASLLGRLGMKATEALPGITGEIISCILNGAKDVVGWASQNLWALVVGIGGLIYTYMVTRR